MSILPTGWTEEWVLTDSFLAFPAKKRPCHGEILRIWHRLRFVSVRFVYNLALKTPHIPRLMKRAGPGAILVRDALLPIVPRSVPKHRRFSMLTTCKYQALDGRIDLQAAEPLGQH